MKVKRIVSLVICFVMLLSCLSSNVLAYNYTDRTVLTADVIDGDETTLPTFSAEFRSKDDFATVLTKDDIRNLSGGSNFYMVFTATNFDHFVGNAAAKFAGIAYKLKYSTQYFTLITKAAQMGNLMANNASSALYDTYAYGHTLSSDTTGGYITINYSAYDSSDMYAMESSEIVAIVEFQKNDVTQPATGTTAESFSFYNLPTTATKDEIGLNNLSVTFGDGLTYGYTYNAADTHLQDYLVLDDSDVDVWPENYTVNFYDSYDAADGYGTQITDADETFEFTVEAHKTIAEYLTENADKALPLYGTDFDYPDPSVEGKMFAGWKYVYYKSEVDPSDSENTIVVEYEETFDTSLKLNPNFFAPLGDGVTELKVYATYEDGKKIIFNTNYDLSTHKIDNAAITADSTKNVYIAPTETVIAYDNTYLPTVGGTGADFRVPDGHAFAGWYTDPACNDGDEFTFENTTTGDTGTTVADGDEVYAKWVAQVNVKFFQNYGPETSGATPLVATYQVPSGGSLDATQLSGLAGLAALSRTDYNLVGWNTQPNGSGTTYEYNATQGKLLVKATGTEATFSAETLLYAMWEATGSDKVTLTFNPNDVPATITPGDTLTVNKGDVVYSYMVPTVTPTTTGYNNVAWYPQAAKPVDAADEIDFSAGLTVNDNTTVYAHWETYTGTTPAPVTVNFYNPDNTTVYASIQVASGTTLTGLVPVTAPAKTGYSFKEWNTDPAGVSGTAYTLGQSITPTTNLDLYPQYTQDITVQYMENMTDEETPTPDFETTQPAGDLYKEPTDTTITDKDGNTYTAPTRSGYKLVGWNTARNGSGTYVAADGIETYSTVSGGITPLVLWAQWAAVPESEIPDVIGGTPADPDQTVNGVKVTFDSNDAGHTPKATPANPLYKYPKLGDAIGTYNMPEKPISTNYTFAGWNTKQDGSGAPVDGGTAITTALGATAIAGTTTSYEITLYAQWTVTDQTNKATITFDSNLNGKMDGTIDSFDTVDVHPNDSMGYELSAKPTNGQYTFDKWVLADGTAFTSSTTVSADTTVYATWTRSIIAKISDKTAPYQYPYANAIISPAWALYENVVDGTGTLVEKPIDSTDINVTDIVFKYLTDANDPSTATDLKEIGTYYADAEPGTNLGAGLGITVSIPDFEIKVVSKGLNFTVDTNTQTQKVDAPPTGLTIETTDATGLYTVEYYLWNNDGDALVETNELQLVTDNADIIGAAAKPESYVVKIVLTDSTRYHIETVTAKDGTTTIATVNHDTTAYPTGNNLGQNLSYIIEPNDPSLDSVTITSGVDSSGTYTASGDVTLRKNVSPDYDVTTFVTGPNGVDTTTKTVDYLVQVHTKTDTKVQFTIKPTADTTLLTAPTTGTGVTVSGTAASGWVITVDRNIDTGIAADPDDDIMLVTDVSIVTTAGTASDAPTYTYNFKILGSPKIRLTPGNSPYGEILNDGAISDKIAARDAFINNGYKFIAGNANTPARVAAQATDGRTYTIDAWSGATDAANNMDLNGYAIFGYEQTEFFDTGFSVIDSLGVDKTSEVVRTIDITRLTGNDMNETSSTLTVDPITIPAGTNSLNAIVDASKKLVRPGKYPMTYSYTDSVLGTITGTREIIILPILGDVNLVDATSMSDYTRIQSMYQGSAILAAADIYDLVAYRVGDLNGVDAITMSDATYIQSKYQKGESITQFYVTTTAPSSAS